MDWLLPDFVGPPTVLSFSPHNDNLMATRKGCEVLVSLPVAGKGLYLDVSVRGINWPVCTDGSVLGRHFILDLIQ